LVTETDGIVLRNVKTAVGRSMLLIFTRQYGKISVGTSLNDRNSRSKSSLAIRPFTYGRYELYRGRETYNLNGGEVKKSFYAFGEDLDKYIYASFLLELTERVLSEDVPEPELFNILLEVLYAMEKRTQAFDTLVIAYMVKMLGCLGVSPNMDYCNLCGSDKPSIFSIVEGGMICEDCHKKITINTHGGPAATLIYAPKFDIVRTMKYFEAKPIKDFEKIALEEGVSKELWRILREYISYHLDVGPLKSEGMMQSH